MPRATSRTSALTASHRLATSLMNDTFVARKAFDAYLMSSADARTEPVGPPASASNRSTNAAVPTGTVDLLITTDPGRRIGAISRTAASRMERSAAPAWFGGVCTHKKTNSAFRTAVAAPTTKVGRRAARPSATNAGRPSSRTGTSPLLRRATFSRSSSPHTTSWPSRAKQAAVVNPTYPPPTTAIALTNEASGSALRGVGRRGLRLPLRLCGRARCRRLRRRGRRGALGRGRVGRRYNRLEVRPEHDGDVGLDDRLVLNQLADAAEVALDHPRLVERTGTIVDLGRVHAGLIADAHVHEALLV